MAAEAMRGHCPVTLPLWNVSHLTGPMSAVGLHLVEKGAGSPFPAIPCCLSSGTSHQRSFREVGRGDRWGVTSWTFLRTFVQDSSPWCVAQVTIVQSAVPSPDWVCQASGMMNLPTYPPGGRLHRGQVPWLLELKGAAGRGLVTCVLFW